MKGGNPEIMQKMPVVVMVIRMRIKFHVLPLVSLKSGEVKAWGYLLLLRQYVVVAETMSYASFISMSAAVVSNFEDWRSKCLKLFVVVQTICGRHGNDVIHMFTKFIPMHASAKSED